MVQRPQEGNVTWVNFGQRKKVSSAEEARLVTGERVDSKQVLKARAAQEPEEPVFSDPAQVIYNAAMRATDQGRFTRGRRYAEGGNVLDLRVESGRFVSTVAGSQNEPFNVMVLLPYREGPEITEALDMITRQPSLLDLARRGRFDRGLLDILFASSDERFRYRCDCPDVSDVCKHAVAVSLKAAELVDSDPSMVFRLRNLDVNTLDQQLRETAGQRAKDSAAEGSEFFWAGHELPALPQPKVAPMIEDSDLDLLHKAMQTISFTNIDQLRAVSDLEDLYDALTRS